MLERTIQEQGIDASGLCFDDQVHTTLALVLKKENGDRDFSFYRNPGADIMLKEEEVRCDLIERSRIFHFGSLSLTDEPVITATHRAMDCAKKAGCLISFDPNLREPLWNSLDEAKAQIDWGMKQLVMFTSSLLSHTVLPTSHGWITRQLASGTSRLLATARYLSSRWMVLR